MSNDIPAMAFHWDGESLIPLRPKMADRYYVVGMDYPMVVHEERSTNSHNHYFASLNEAWKNLPEHLAIQHPTVEHLRKWALIQAHYCDERQFVCASKAEAVRLAGFMQPMDTYAIIVITECVVTVYTAKSQKLRAMGKEEFQRSKSEVLDIVAAMAKTDPETLQANAGQAA